VSVYRFVCPECHGDVEWGPKFQQGGECRDCHHRYRSVVSLRRILDREEQP